MKLFYTPSSPFVRKVVVSAYETGQSLEFLPCLARPTTPDPKILPHNPSGKIPTLLISDDLALYDSRVITRWLDTQHQGPKLYPDGDALWPVLRREATADGLLEAAMLIRYETVLRPSELRWPAWIKDQREKIDRALARMELDVGEYIGVDAGWIATACAIDFINFRFPDWNWESNSPRLAEWFRTFAQRPSMQATAPTDRGR